MIDDRYFERKYAIAALILGIILSVSRGVELIPDSLAPFSILCFAYAFHYFFFHKKRKDN